MNSSVFVNDAIGQPFMEWTATVFATSKPLCSSLNVQGTGYLFKSCTKHKIAFIKGQYEQLKKGFLSFLD